MTRTRVFIATTQGPAQVRVLAREQPRMPGQGHEIFSDVYLSDPFEKLPIADQYKDFVRKPTGVIERLFGHPVYMMELSRRVVGGESWKLGAFAAHALLNEDQLAQRDDPASRVVWATGDVSRDDDLAIRSVGHVRQKLEQSAELIAACRASGTPLSFLMPADDFEQLDPTWLEAWRSEQGADEDSFPIVPVKSAFELGPLLDLPGLTRIANAPERSSAAALAANGAVAVADPWPSSSALPDALHEQSTSGRGWTWASLVLAVAAGSWIVTHGLPDRRSPPVPIATTTGTTTTKPAETATPRAIESRPAPEVEAVPAPARPPASAFAIGIEEHALADGRNCALYGTPEAITTRVVGKQDATFDATRGSGLCAIDYRVDNRYDAPLHVWLQVVPLERGPRYEAQRRQGRLRAATIAPNERLTIEIEPPTFARRDTRYRVIAAAAFEGSGEVAAILPSAEDAIEADWASIERRLEALGVTVARATHEVRVE